MSADSIKLVPLLAAIDAHILAGVPKLATVANHTRMTAETKLPAVLTEIADISLRGNANDGTDRLCITPLFSSFVVYSTVGDERENQIAVRALALRIAHHIAFSPLAAAVENVRVADIAPDFLKVGGDNSEGQNNARLIACQRVDWEADGYVGANVWDELETELLVLGQPQVTDEYLSRINPESP